MKKVGIFGGRFDPIHTGHLIIARDVKELLNLEKIVFLVSFNPPHKPTVADFEDRVEMVRRAIKGERGFEVSTLEREMGLPKTYTVLVLQELKRRIPKADLYFLLGSDQYAEFPRWYHPEKILELANLVVLLRPEIEIPKTIYKPNRIVFFKKRTISISSTEIRKRSSEGKSIRFLVPESVREYIEKRKIYRMG